MTTDTRWAIDCADGFGRPRMLRVCVEPGDVILGFPPGETAALAGGQLVGLFSVLGVAGHLAEAPRKARGAHSG